MRRKGSTMFRNRMWHGAMTENVCSAVASDIKLDAMRRLDEKGLGLIAEVHDEVVVESKEREADYELGFILGTMEQTPGYVPSGLIEAEGGLCERYTKI